VRAFWPYNTNAAPLDLKAWTLPHFLAGRSVTRVSSLTLRFEPEPVVLLSLRGILTTFYETRYSALQMFKGINSQAFACSMCRALLYLPHQFIPAAAAALAPPADISNTESNDQDVLTSLERVQSELGDTRTDDHDIAERVLADLPPDIAADVVSGGASLVVPSSAASAAFAATSDPAADSMAFEDDHQHDGMSEQLPRSPASKDPASPQSRRILRERTAHANRDDA
jgi:hypothetical protein